MNRMAQKVGEEAIELVIEAKDNNNKLFLNEAADLMFHYLVLLQAKNKTLEDVISVLEKRHKDVK
jgi:phosphoribosyl-ATP pyrophosphohydrolase/phosphoribosyl-AMP cyclohydrolase